MSGNVFCVVKVGGSIYRRTALAPVMMHLADLFGNTQTLIVPGGGVFADQVRSAQKRWGFDDLAAHRMALLAMRQYGHLLAAVSKLPTTEQLTASACAIWLPGEDQSIWLPEGADLPLDWRLTSDSIALCVAARTRAKWLVLLKPVSPHKAGSACELVDECFPKLYAECNLRVAVLTSREWLDLRSADDVANYDATEAFAQTHQSAPPPP